MPNRRGEISEDIEQAHPWPPGRFAEAEPQERRGAPGSRGMGSPAGQRRDEDAAGPRGGVRGRLTPDEWSGVNPLPPIDPAMPRFKPGDQGG